MWVRGLACVNVRCWIVCRRQGKRLITFHWVSLWLRRQLRLSVSEGSAWRFIKSHWVFFIFFVSFWAQTRIIWLSLSLFVLYSAYSSNRPGIHLVSCSTAPSQTAKTVSISSSWGVSKQLALKVRSGHAENEPVALFLELSIPSECSLDVICVFFFFFYQRTIKGHSDAPRMN